MPFPREQRSLFGEILDWMLAPLLLLWPMSVVLTWLVAQGIANKPFDRELSDKARMLAQQVSQQTGTDGRQHAAFALPDSTVDLLHGDEGDTLYYQITDTEGQHLSGERAMKGPVEEESPTLGAVRLRDDELHGEPVRVASIWVRVPGAVAPAAPLVQVAETLGKRSRLATEIIKGVMLPQFVILPVAVLLVWLALARGIAPLNELQQRIRRRESHDLSPIDERGAPEEVSPLVQAINDLLARLDRSIGTQKHFLADAAHQLKTPLAGLRMQAELAQRDIDAGRLDPQVLKESLHQIARSSQRATHMVNQLLAMARAESNAQSMSHAPVDLVELATDVVRDFVPQALDKRIDLGFEGPIARGPLPPASARINGHAMLLRELLGNLVDNALHYTPDGGTVTVRVVADPFGQVVVLQVEDSGPGIAPSERDKVFQPFYRALGTNVDGSGLGLAIVLEIGQQHQVAITLEDAVPRARAKGGEAAHSGQGPGARFTLRFAALRPQPDTPPGDEPSPPDRH
ncbi:MAG: hypothetical protein RLZZ618_3925 [Pseudomonadota bacterium]|jgi:two-component system sensor histidine kinase TctE